jgi:hypothetical protein
MRTHCLAVLLGLAGAQCGGIARTSGVDLCQSGEQLECDCVGHTKGVRICSAQGVGFGECICSGGGMDAGGALDGGGGPPTSACSSKSSWTGGLLGSADMTPGRPCIACHLTAPQSPQYTVAGTIYGNLHDPDDCNGIDGHGVAVAFLNDSGMEIGNRVQVNRVGNFVYSRPMPPAYRIKIIAGGIERLKQTPVTNGDCNLCHTASGAQGARGRIVKPVP